MTTIRQERLDNGLEISFSDESNRYFGDYHHICVVATIGYPLERLADDELRLRAIAAYGRQFRAEKRFERMGVPTADVVSTRNSLIDDFMRHAFTYLSRPDYPHLLVTAELSKHRTGRFYA